MRIEHTAMYVRDLEAAREFFIKYFSAEAGCEYHNERTGFRSYFLSFESGGRLELMSKPGMKPSDGESLGYVHLAFSVGSRERVDELTERLRADGYRVVSGPRTTGDGYYESAVEAVEGNLVEITV